MADDERRGSVVRVVPHMQRIEKVYLAVTDLDNEDSEGVYSVTGASDQLLPVVAIDDKGLAILSQYAQSQAEATGKTVSIICFTHRTVHEKFAPVATGDKTS